MGCDHDAFDAQSLTFFSNALSFLFGIPFSVVWASNYPSAPTFAKVLTLIFMCPPVIRVLITAWFG